MTAEKRIGATDFQNLTTEEASAIRALHRLSRRWPKTLLLLFGGTGALTVRKPVPGKLYDARYVVATIEGIPSDGGDGGVEFDEAPERINKEVLKR